MKLCFLFCLIFWLLKANFYLFLNFLQLALAKHFPFHIFRQLFFVLSQSSTMKCVFITGGVYSGLGKGIAAASIAKLIQSMGSSVTMVKMDPYLQIDAGTMSPYEHGEVFVTDDGGETDLDVGNYERFINVSLTRDNNITSGKIYQSVINKERHGDYLGKTVQVVPHIVDEIKDWIKRCGA